MAFKWLWVTQVLLVTTLASPIRVYDHYLQTSPSRQNVGGLVNLVPSEPTINILSPQHPSLRHLPELQPKVLTPRNLLPREIVELQPTYAHSTSSSPRQHVPQVHSPPRQHIPQVHSPPRQHIPQVHSPPRQHVPHVHETFSKTKRAQTPAIKKYVRTQATYVGPARKAFSHVKSHHNSNTNYGSIKRQYDADGYNGYNAEVQPVTYHKSTGKKTFQTNPVKEELNDGLIAFYKNPLVDYKSSSKIIEMVGLHPAFKQAMNADAFYDLTSLALPGKGHSFGHF